MNFKRVSLLKPTLLTEWSNFPSGRGIHLRRFCQFCGRVLMAMPRESMRRGHRCFPHTEQWTILR